MYKLNISSTVRFVARLSVRDADKTVDFQARLQVDRLPPGITLDAAVAQHPGASEFLAARNLKLLSWEGDARPPLVDEAGNPAPADDKALAALMAEVGTVNALLGCYIEAVGVKAKLGN